MGNRITVVRLLNVPLENNYKNTLYFTSKDNQASYFAGCKVYESTNLSYQRKERAIDFPKHIDSLTGCNYVMHKNNTTKWYYSFINRMEYVNDGMTRIYIETDAIQTWLFDYTVGSSFVERQHVTDDTKGLHTVPEGLELGEYKVAKRNANESLLVKTLVIATTVDINSEDYANIAGTTYNGVFSGVKYYKVTPEQCNKIIKDLADEGKSDAIVSIFTVPSLFISSTAKGTYSEVDAGDSVDYGAWINTFGVDEEPIEKPTTIDGYTPKNNKLFTYPYCYMLMSNNAGGCAIYHYEKFDSPDGANKCDFRIYSALTPGMSIRIVPRYYNGTTNNNDEGLNLGKFPICSWNTDVYTNWLTQNAVNIGVSIASGLATTAFGVGAVATGAGAVAGGSMVAGGLAQVANTVGEVYAHSKMPPQAEGNVNSGDVSFSAGYLTFTAHEMTIKAEYARIIDEFFDMFGYKVNRVVVPNKNHRENYWYTKCIDVNIKGAIPTEDLQTIRNAYNNGITFWKNPANIMNYSVSNKPI